MGNSVLPGIVRAACESLELPWGHVSSGCIFTGRRADGGGFTEYDPPNFTFRQNNCSFYSGTKALGEEVLEGAKRCYIWRLRIPFENTANPRNYLQKLLSYQTLLEAENSLSQLEEFVQACLDCFRLRLPYGRYNLTNPGSIWTSEITALIRASGITDKEFQFFDCEEQFMRLAAKTPRSNCVLNSTKAIEAGLRLTPVVHAIEQTLSRWTSHLSLATH
jgi:dTDP-4-dehydrorhamnose reductase